MLAHNGHEETLIRKELERPDALMSDRFFNIIHDQNKILNLEG